MISDRDTRKHYLLSRPLEAEDIQIVSYGRKAQLILLIYFGVFPDG